VVIIEAAHDGQRNDHKGQSNHQHQPAVLQL
jgi:hypothetical protein